MRVTSSRMMEIATEATTSSQSRVATAAAQVSSGQRVLQPSDDLVGWEQGMRANIRNAESTQRGSALNQGIDKLSSTGDALTSINDALTTAKSLATQMANGTLNAAQRQAAQQQVQAIHDQVLGYMNAKGSDGQPLFGGSQAGTPFSATGTYSGDNVTQSMEISEGHTAQVGVPGSVLTAANGGVDVLGTLSSLATALGANNLAGVQQGLSDIGTAQTQVTNAQAMAGSQLTALNNANDARSEFESNLTKTVTNSMGADPVSAASALAQAQNAFNASETVAQVINQMAGKTILS